MPGINVPYYDNKYVQYRYMGSDTTGSPNPFLDTVNWQGVDAEPTNGSHNLVESGGVFSDTAKSAYSLQNIYPNGKCTELTDISVNGDKVKTLITGSGIKISGVSSVSYPIASLGSAKVEAGHRYVFLVDFGMDSDWFLRCFYDAAGENIYSEYIHDIKQRQVKVFKIDTVVPSDGGSWALSLPQEDNSYYLYAFMLFDFGDSTSPLYNLDINSIKDIYEKRGFFVTFRPSEYSLGNLAKVNGAVDGNIPQFNNGELEDSGKSIDDIPSVVSLPKNLADNGKCTETTDINLYTATGKSVSVLKEGGLKISGTSISDWPSIILNNLNGVNGHRYVVLLDAKLNDARYTLWCEDGTSGNNTYDINTNAGVRKVYCGEIFAAGDFVNFYITLGKITYDDILYKFLIFDCGNSDSEFYNSPFSYFENLYDIYGFFTTLTVVNNSKFAESAGSIINNDSNYKAIKHSTKLVDLSNIKIAFLGDSITNLGFSEKGVNNLYNGFITYFSREYGINKETQLVNLGEGGRRLSYRYDDVAPEVIPMVDAVHTIPLDSDVVVVTGGACDAGSLSYTQMGSYEDEYNKKTIFGAVGSIIRDVRNRLPLAKLVFCTPPRREGDSQTATYFASTHMIAETIKTACKYYGIPVIDFYDNCGINEFTIKSNPNLLAGVPWTENSDIDSNGSVISGDFYVSNPFNVEQNVGYWCSAGFLYYYNANSELIGSKQIFPSSMIEYTVPDGTVTIRMKVTSLEGGTIDGSHTNLGFSKVKGDLISDGVHLNAYGQRVWASYFSHEILKYLCQLSVPME